MYFKKRNIRNVEGVFKMESLYQQNEPAGPRTMKDKVRSVYVQTKDYKDTWNVETNNRCTLKLFVRSSVKILIRFNMAGWFVLRKFPFHNNAKNDL